MAHVQGTCAQGTWATRYGLYASRCSCKQLREDVLQAQVRCAGSGGRWHQEDANHGRHSSHASQVLDLTCTILKRLLVWPTSTTPAVAHSALLEVRCR